MRQQLQHFDLSSAFKAHLYYSESERETHVVCKLFHIIKAIFEWQKSKKNRFSKFDNKQECIPVGCLPSASMAVGKGGGVCRRAGVSAVGPGCLLREVSARHLPREQNDRHV